MRALEKIHDICRAWDRGELPDQTALKMIKSIANHEPERVTYGSATLKLGDGTVLGNADNIVVTLGKGAPRE